VYVTGAGAVSLNLAVSGIVSQRSSIVHVISTSPPAQIAGMLPSQVLVTVGAHPPVTSVKIESNHVLKAASTSA